jgi:hypothetical protein
MDVSNALRQVEEILTLKDQWYSGEALTIKTPALLSRLQQIRSSATGQLEVKKCLVFHINCAVLHPDELPHLILEFEFPLDYPSESTCRVKALIRSSDPDLKWLEHTPCTTAIGRYLESFCGFECADLVLDWLAENKDSCLNENECTLPSLENVNDEIVTCYIIRYNHLLSGPEHKKEKSMIDAAKKSKLQGGLLWGTPGVVIVVPPSTEEDAKEYASECRTIGKRPSGVEELHLPQTGIEEAGLGGLAQQKRGGRLQELDTAGLRLSCGGDDNLLRTVLGVQ